MSLLSLRDVSLSFGGPKILDHVDLQIARGDRLCLLGRNGEGKSTLLRLVEGDLIADDGEVLRQTGLRIARLPQQVPEDLNMSVGEAVAEGLPEDGHPRLASDHRVQTILSRIGLDPDVAFDSLSSGMKRRALLARSIAADPDILLLDEPTNHLDIDSIAWLENFLLRFDGTLVFVTHDRVFLSRLATRIVELDRGKVYDWACDYPTFLVRREEVLHAETRQQALFDKRLAQEEVWIRKGVEARRTRNEGRVRSLKAMREQRMQRREKQGIARVQVQEAERSGTLVVEAKDVAFRYGETPIVSGLTTTLMRGDKVGIIGPNGAGKTTLLRLLLGQLEPTSGTIRQGTKLEVAYFDQLKATLDDEETVQRNVSEYDSILINGQPRHIMGYLQDFLFSPERARSLVKTLSGGERTRLLLAKLFTKPSNVLVLDEPTNDLDVETLELLEALIVDYDGTVLIVSHDRAFLDEVVTSTFAFEPGGEVREYDGGYEDYLRQRAASLSEAAPAKNAPAPRVEKGKGRKLGYKEKLELEAFPAKIESMEAESARLQAVMGHPSFYRKDRAEIAETTALLARVQADLAIAYARWERLEGMAD
jgi:ATP-binding cassette subfamily F protein uup